MTKTIHCCLITRPQNGGRGGGAYFKFQPIGGYLFEGGAYSRGDANSKIYGMLKITNDTDQCTGGQNMD